MTNPKYEHCGEKQECADDKVEKRLKALRESKALGLTYLCLSNLTSSVREFRNNIPKRDPKKMEELFNISALLSAFSWRIFAAYMSDGTIIEDVYECLREELEAEKAPKEI